MNLRRAAAVALAALSLTIGPPATLAGDDAPPQAPIQSPTLAHTEALDRAWHEGRTDEFRRLAATASTIDPFLVLLRLLRLSHERGFPFADADRDLIAALGGPDAAGKLAPGVGAAAEGWLAASAEEVTTELRLSAARELARRPYPSGGNPALLARLRAIDENGIANPLSLAGPIIRHEIASLVRRSGRPAEGLELATRLREEGRTRRWPMLEAMCLDVMGDALHQLGRYDEALAVRRDEVAIRASVGLRLDHANSEAWRASAALKVGLIDESAESSRVAAAVYMAAGKREPGLAEKLRLAACAIYAGRIDEAESVAREVRDEAARLGLVVVELNACAQIATSLWRNHRAGEALAVCEANLPRAEAGGHDVPLRMLRLEAARALLYLHLHDAAVVHLEAILSKTKGDTSPSWRALALGELGRIDVRRGRYVEARGRLEETVKILESLGETLRLARAEADLSRCCELQGDAAAALAAAERAVKRMTDRSAASVRARAFASRGEARLAAGDAAGAVRDLEEAVRISSSGNVTDSGSHLYLREALGRCLVAAGRPADALPHLRASGEAILASTKGLADDESLGLRGNLRNLASRGTLAASQLAAAEPARSAEAAAAAWWFEEAARARSLGEALAGCGPRHGGTIPADLLAEEREALTGVVRARRDAVESGWSPDPQKALVAANTALDAAYLRLRQTDAKIARTGAASPTTSPRPIALPDLQRRLGGDAALLTYSLAGERVFALVVTDSSATLTDIGTSASLRETAQAWTELASTPDGPEELLAGRLYAALLRPFENVLERRSRLFVVPDDVLACIPFDALVRRHEGRAERVVERWEVVCLPSATVLDLLDRETAGRAAARGVVVLGDPAYPDVRASSAATPRPDAATAMRSPTAGLVPLPRSGDEARAVAALYPEEGRTLLLREHATVREFLDAASPSGAPRRVLHAACHAIVDGDHPRLSGLVFAGGEVLDVETLVRARLSSDLAVLSACETAGGTFERGEGMIGLTRGFLVAGVPRVVVTAWRVADDSTADLMRTFHERLVRGESPATALRAVKLACLKKGGAAAHPYGWAPFMLWGLP